ncbi:MAG TPA: EAL domain-containing protein [Actinomycetota bacterium]|nr:EAL domain-containing protein [Actinomycetota bacterium]HRV66822.1 EAL domain-containing protein [Candidatus Nanopelagicales bacterium]
MASATQGRPSLWRPSMFSVTWQASTWLGWAIVVLSVVRLSPEALRAMGEPLLMIAAVIVISELRPIVMTRLIGNPVSISLAFVFATMYLWGLYPAVLLYAGSVLLSEFIQRKPPWKFLFNVGQYTCSMAAAWAVLHLAGVQPSPFDPHAGLSASDLWWIVTSWIVYHLVNLALVAGLAEDGESTWWEDFSDQFWFYTFATLAVLALSPLIAIVAVATPYSWTLLPLLLLPLLAVQKTAEMSRKQEHQALHDPLTGLPNRLLLTDRIEQALVRSGRTEGSVLVMFLDLDLFKVVNDSLGHHAGDALLIDVARRLQSAVRPGDTLARFGGDEFVIVCDGIAADEVTTVPERISASLMQPFASLEREVTVSASIGVALATDTSDAQTLIRDADVAMYRAKERGRNQVVLFHQVMHQEADERLQDSVGLRRALDRDEFRLHYQPVVEVATGQTIGMEAMIRWQDPHRGLLDAGTFIPAAEETGLIVPIGYWVIDTAIAQVQSWRTKIPQASHLWVAVNISSRQLLAPGLVDHLGRTLQETGVPASAVHLEITESALMSDLSAVVERLAALRSLGLRLAIDDFGTGYSSLAYLKRLPVTTVKIDRSFVNGLGGAEDAFDRPIVDAIIKMAQSLHLDVVAEGVETREQLVTLQALGTRAAQGFLWSPPLPEQEVPDWITAHVPAL